MSEQHRYFDCILSCSSCANACERCVTLSLSEKDLGLHVRCMQLARDCADICRLSAALMLRESEHASALCHLCKDVCLACADECVQHDRRHCQECARTCQVCADACAVLLA